MFSVLKPERHRRHREAGFGCGQRAAFGFALTPLRAINHFLRREGKRSTQQARKSLSAGVVSVQCSLHMAHRAAGAEWHQCTAGNLGLSCVYIVSEPLSYCGERALGDIPGPMI